MNRNVKASLGGGMRINEHALKAVQIEVNKLKKLEIKLSKYPHIFLEKGALGDNQDYQNQLP